LSFPFVRLEQLVASHADAVIVIAPGFADTLAGWGVPQERVSVIENWAPLDEIREFPRTNEWSAKHGLDGKTVFLYSGTLGIKHRPDLLYRLAQSLDPSCRLVVITEGIGREYLEKMPRLETLQLMDFQPYDQVSLALASADVLVATLESSAGQFAVPSKILSNLCAGRPMLVASPQLNLAAAIVERSGSGYVIDPDCPEAFISAAKQLAMDPVLRSLLGINARQYAERTFEISHIAMRFEDLLSSASAPTQSVLHSHAPMTATQLPSLAVSDPNIQPSTET
jgi:colanic acid biosynthesis glycosyl transferase WcaI